MTELTIVNCHRAPRVKFVLTVDILPGGIIVFSPVVLYNANILTQNAERPVANRMAWWNGNIIGVDEEIDFLFDGTPASLSTVEKINAKGATVLPGFNDVHAHSVWYGQTLIEVDLASCYEAGDVYAKIRDHAKSLQETDWVICSNYNPYQLSGERPSVDALDQASEYRPVVLKHASGHALTVSLEALKRAGIEEFPKSQPTGGEIVTDREGRVTGLLDENAMRYINDLLLPDPDATLADALGAASEQYVAEGITSVTDAGIAGGWIGHSPREFGAYHQALESNRLLHRTQTMITMDALHSIPGSQSDPDVLGLDAGVRTGVGNEWLQIGPVKLFTDGSLLGATAAMTEEYAHCPHNHGYLQDEPEVMRNKALQAAAGKWALALHAIGDAAVDFAIETITEARALYGPACMPDRIEHGGCIRQDQIEKMAQQGIVLVPQAHFVATYGDTMTKNLGTARSQLSYPGKSLLNAGMVLPGSSDRPVAHGAPMSVIQSFVERLTETGKPYGPAERVSVEEALKVYTRGSAWATGWNGRKGVISTNYLADFVLLEEDPRIVDSSQISQVGIKATVVGGKTVYGNLSA